MGMFGTNGIRGMANEYLSCELATKIGRSVGAVLGRDVAVAMDPRTSSQMIKSALCAGLMSVGANVHDLGMVPTPALQHYIRVRPGITGGVMITASHNPPEYNGIKCISGDGTECSPSEESRIETLYESGVDPVSWDHIGTISQVNCAGEEYVESIVSKVDAEAIRAAKLTICIDCANGASANTTPLLLKRLGVRAITLNGNPQGEFPGHPSEPTEDNLDALKRMVVDTGANLGAAHDGDADRCIFITESGRYVGGDQSLALLAEHIVCSNGGGSVVVTVATSSVVKDAVASAGGRTIVTAVGSPIVARTMIEESSIFGGEENGGLIFSDHQYCRDGAMGLARMLELVATSGSLDDLVDGLPTYTTVKRTIACDDSVKSGLCEIVAANHHGESMNRVDGLRIDYEDGWVLMRPSGTEPKFRIYSESRDPETAMIRSQKFTDEIEAAINTNRHGPGPASPSSA